MTMQLVALHMAPYGGPFFFHPGLLWLGLLLFLVLRKRPGGYRHHGHHERRVSPAPEPQRQEDEPQGDGPAWPALYPDEQAPPPQTPGDRPAGGKIEYF